MLRTLLATLSLCTQSHRDLILENLALHQQLATVARHQAKPRLTSHDRFFWLALRPLRPGFGKLGYSFNPTQSSVDIYPDSGCIGNGCPANIFPSDASLQPSSSANWSSKWSGRTLDGVRPGRELLDHVIVLNRHHLKRSITEYIRRCSDDRTHLGLGKDMSTGSKAAQSTTVNAAVVSIPRFGCLYLRYELAA